MEWFVLSNPVPPSVEFPLVVGGMYAVGLLAAVIPVILAARAAWEARKATPEVPRLGVIEGGRTLSRRAA